MAAARTFEQKRARLRALESAPPKEAEAELRKLLEDRNGYIAGEAAEVAKKLELSSLTQELSKAFFRLLEDGAKDDKGCFGKKRIIDALVTFDAFVPDVYLRGLRHVQIEGSYPKPVDTAGGLRGLCAHALVYTRHRQALLDVAPLLLDPDPVTRAEAAGALGASGQDGAAAALHVKALTGDQEADVMGAVYRALVKIAPERYVPFVTGVLLGDDEGLVEAAALAIGEARPPGALDALKRAAAAHRMGRAAEGVLLAIALLRSDEANQYLVSLVERGPEGEAVGALSALALHRHDEALVKRLCDIVTARKLPRLGDAFDHKFLTR